MFALDHYDYELPAELIAQHPPPRRSDARLLVVRRNERQVAHAGIDQLDEFLNPGDCVVLNDTQVVPARLEGRRTNTGGRWTGLFLSAEEHGLWKVLSKTRGKLVCGETVTLHDRAGSEELLLRLLANLGAGVWAVRPEAPSHLFPHPKYGIDPNDPLVLLNQFGRVPLPHYIRDGKTIEQDTERYQTIYAANPGSVAAPTAGLHFTSALLSRLIDRGVFICKVTLHVGIGTFRPILTESVADHTMHAEWGSISPHVARQLSRRRAAGGRLIAVGTTTVRVLETAASAGELQGWTGATDLFIHPPYQFRAVDALLTNFHLPRSTLLVLVRTFGGDELVQRAYQEAIAEQYRFFSYGDAMLIV